MNNELAEIARSIEQRRKQGLSLGDIDTIVKRLEKTQKNTGIDTTLLAKNIATGAASVVTSRLPSPKDFVNAFVNSNPFLKIGSTMLSGVVGSIQDLMGSSVAEQSTEAEKMLAELERLRESLSLAPETTTEQLDDIAKATAEALKLKANETHSIGLVGDKVATTNGLIEELLDIQRDIRHQLYYFNDIVKEKQRWTDMNNFQQLDNSDNTFAPVPKAGGDNSEILQDIKEGQDAETRATVLAGMRGMMGSALAAAGSMLGGIMGGAAGGLLGSGSVLSKVGKFGKIMGWVGLVIGAVVEGAEGWKDPEKILGEGRTSLKDKFEAAAVNILGSLMAPVDWVLTQLTGEKFNLEERTKKFLAESFDNIGEMLSPFFNGLIDIGVGFAKDLVKNLHPDTKMVDVPGILLDNLIDIAHGAMNTLKSVAGKGLSKVESVAEEIYNSIVDSIKGFFTGLINGVTDYLNKKFETVDNWLGDNIGNPLSKWIGGDNEVPMERAVDIAEEIPKAGELIIPDQATKDILDSVSILGEAASNLSKATATSVEMDKKRGTGKMANINQQVNAPVTNNHMSVGDRISVDNPYGRSLIPAF